MDDGRLCPILGNRGSLAWEKGKMSAETEICQKLGIGGEKPETLHNNGK